MCNVVTFSSLLEWWYEILIIHCFINLYYFKRIMNSFFPCDLSFPYNKAGLKMRYIRWWLFFLLNMWTQLLTFLLVHGFKKLYYLGLSLSEGNCEYNGLDILLAPPGVFPNLISCGAAWYPLLRNPGKTAFPGFLQIKFRVSDWLLTVKLCHLLGLCVHSLFSITKVILGAICSRWQGNNMVKSWCLGPWVSTCPNHYLFLMI